MTMKKLVRPEDEIEHPTVSILWGVLHRNGYEASYVDIQWAWREYSEFLGRYWIAVPTDNDALILQVLTDRLVAERNDSVSAQLTARNERLQNAIKQAVDHAGSHCLEWGERAEECFAILERAIKP